MIEPMHYCNLATGAWLHLFEKISDLVADLGPVLVNFLVLFQVDGKSFLPYLRGSTSVSHGHEFLRHYCGRDLHALRFVDSGNTD